MVCRPRRGEATLVVLALIALLAAREGATQVTTVQDEPRPPRLRLRASSSPPQLDPVRVARLSGGAGPVYHLAWSPDDALLAAAGFGEVKVWDMRSYTAATTLTGHTSYVWGVSWSPDGSLLATASQDRSVRLWDAATYEQVASLPTGWAFAVSWSPDGTRLASVGSRVQIWDVASRSLIRAMQLVSSGFSVAWSPDGRLIASGEFNGSVRSWDADTGEPLGTFVATGVRSDVNGLAWSPRGPFLAAAQQDSRLRVWHTGSWQVVRSFAGYGGWLRAAAWSRDGRLLVTSGEDANAFLWHFDTGTLLATLPMDGHPVWSAAWSHDGRRLAIGDGDFASTEYAGNVDVWRLAGQ